MKKILITGSNSYIGESFDKYLSKWPDSYRVQTIDVIDDHWRQADFSPFDAVVHVSGKVHAKETKDNAREFYDINATLTGDIAAKAKESGVKQFLFLSTVNVYGLLNGTITRETLPRPSSHYGKSKLAGEKIVSELADDTFLVVILRPPMVYGPGCKGNYPVLQKWATTLPVFPKFENRRSMISIDGLCAFLKNCIDTRSAGVFFPQDESFVCTSNMVYDVAKENNHPIRFTRLFNWPIRLLMVMGVKRVKKIFGDLMYQTDNKKRALMIASMASMLDNFNRPAIDQLTKLGYSVDLAANFTAEDSNSSEKNQSFFNEMTDKGHQVYQINFTRIPMNIKQHIRAYREVMDLANKNDYQLIHCHSPISSVVSRYAFRKKRKQGVRVIYTGHGFHFFKGAPYKNWALYFPMEWICARWTDVLITLNHEDYQLAKRHLHAKKVKYLPGVGVDTSRFIKASQEQRIEKREELGIKPHEVMLLSVGELSKRKNQTLVMRALQQVQNPDIHYFLAGIGSLQEEMESLIEELHLNSQVHLLGFRTDISLLCAAADAFVFPSFHEGLSVALMEAMACGLPVVASRIRGNTDLIDEGKGGYLVDPRDAEGMAQAIKTLVANPEAAAMGQYNMEKVKDFDMEKVTQELRRIYQSVMPESENSAES